jgi:hypothetical protein
VAGKPFDATLKDLVECGADDWPVLAKLPAAPTRIIDADIATVSGAGDKVLRVETKPPFLLHLEFLSSHDSADQPLLFHKRNVLLEERHRLAVRTWPSSYGPRPIRRSSRVCANACFLGKPKPTIAFATRCYASGSYQWPRF